MLSRALKSTKAVASAQKAFASSAVRPPNVGILAAEVYFPSTYVSQSALEKFDGVSEGKYTKGLGLTNMAFCNDREDVTSICMTAVNNLMTKYNIPYTSIGRLEVGTESRVDKSKSIKTDMMRLFEAYGNHDIEGVDSTNACYGGTAALFNSAAWIESSAWDGRYAIAVCGDIAVYGPGNARPTGGVAAVAMLIGPNSDLVLENPLRTSYFEHAYDFYKPDPTSEYPVVDGKLSITCYLRAVDSCYRRFADRAAKVDGTPFNLDRLDYACFHSPFAKMANKSFARLGYNDYLRDPSNPKFAGVNPKLAELTPEASYVDKEIETTFTKITDKCFKEKVDAAMHLPRNLGNSYTASLYTGLLSLIDAEGAKLKDKRICMFSYGSGLAASLFSLKVTQPADNRFTIDHIQQLSQVHERLAQRVEVDPKEYTRILAHVENYHGKKDFTPSDPIDHLFPGTFYVTKVDDLWRTSYEMK